MTPNRTRWQICKQFISSIKNYLKYIYQQKEKSLIEVSAVVHVFKHKILQIFILEQKCKSISLHI